MVSSSLQGFCFPNIKSSIWFNPKVLPNEFDLNYVILSICLDPRSRFHGFFFFFSCIFCFLRQLSLSTHCSSTVYGTHNHFIFKKKLKMSHTILFTYLKIILRQCFQFSVSVKISSIQTDLKHGFKNRIGLVLFWIKSKNYKIWHFN